ncbi:hypothetical protein N7462_010382 [Penicillium macrosclerotiorum]|uniref:uncharacterized protein n=1 Tax=Penicillium macrosclerotiorum TaxID=303699 RepID=UPI002547DD7D|nr:uncharacterized protein N7462_010382 [Penicillium macrosclerotiorum]KAJ5669312.1 hypothetical protein N7462_010382 [Penicillium macrosclerotiorum]
MTPRCYKHKYPPWEAEGECYVRWISDPEARDCIIPRSSFRLGDMRYRGFGVHIEPETIPFNYEEWIHDTDYPAGRPDRTAVYQRCEIVKGSRRGPGDTQSMWMCRLGPGVIFFQDLPTVLFPMDPPVSIVAQALYQELFVLWGLQHLVFDIRRTATETLKCVEQQIYKGLPFPSEQRLLWRYPSPEYIALMGTPVGKIVASFVLGAYGQGVKHVSRITTWQSQVMSDAYYIRFDIDDMS